MQTKRGPKTQHEAWTPLHDIPSWPTPNAEPFASRGHFGGRYLARVHVHPDHVETYRRVRNDATFEQGAVIAVVHLDPSGRQHGPIFAMERQAERVWEFVIADEAGRRREPVSERLCVRCHAEAPHDGVFGPPMDKEPDQGAR